MTAAQGSNTLILSPLSPSGLEAYLIRIASSCPTNPNLIAISYTQPPAEWVSAWKAYAGEVPDRSVFVKGGSVTDDADGEFGQVLSADPADPMSVVVPMEKQLAAWQSMDEDTVVSLQTLSVLLQYSDADTVFRYLNLATHKVRAVGARGYYQIDPGLHDESTVNALKVLFDTVETVSEGELSERRDAQMSANDGPSPVNQLVSLYESSKSRLSDVLAFSEAANDGSAADGGADARADAHAGADPSAGDESGDESDGLAEAGEELLTDGERIRRLLLQSGGQMRQTALVAELPWSSSTVSRKLTELEERGEVSRIQVGRGKVVFYPGNEPDAAKSPFDGTRDQPQISE